MHPQVPRGKALLVLTAKTGAVGSLLRFGILTLLAAVIVALLLPVRRKSA
jgi:hypothetical protein